MKGIHFSFALIAGGNEFESNTCQVKDLQTGTQQDVPLEPDAEKQVCLFQENLGCHRLLLHAWSIEFFHPETAQQLQIQAPLDTEFSHVIEAFGWNEALASWSS